MPSRDARAASRLIAQTCLFDHNIYLSEIFTLTAELLAAARPRFGVSPANIGVLLLLAW
jgi:hypothetical protein